MKLRHHESGLLFGADHAATLFFPEEIAMDKLEGNAKMLLIHIDENDLWDGKPLYEAIVHKLRSLDLAGATVYRGILGYGAKNRVHRSGILGMSHDLPVMISVIDREDKIRGVLPFLHEMVSEGLVALVDVEVVRYASGHHSIQ